MPKLPALFCLVGSATTVAAAAAAAAAAASPFFFITSSPQTGAGNTLDLCVATIPLGPGYVPASLDFPITLAAADCPGASATTTGPSSGWAAYCIRDTLVVNACKNADPTKNFTPHRATATAVEDVHVPQPGMVNATCPATILGATTAPCHSTRLFHQTPINPPRILSLTFHGDDNLPPALLPICHHAHECIKAFPKRGEGVGPIVVVVVVKHMYSSIIKKGVANIDRDETETLSATKSTGAGATTGTSHPHELPLVMAALLLAASGSSGRRCWRTTMLVPILMMLLCNVIAAAAREAAGNHRILSEQQEESDRVAYDVATCEEWAKGYDYIHADPRLKEYFGEENQPGTKCSEDGQKCATSIEQCLKDGCNQL